MAEVVVALAKHSPATAQEIADITGIRYSLVRDVLVRLEKGQVLTSARTGGARSPLLYEPVRDACWAAARVLAEAIAQGADANS
jgi:sugar-specific transcriptional regulator TrmB